MLWHSWSKANSYKNNWEVVTYLCINQQWKLALLTLHSVTPDENQIKTKISDIHLIDRKLDV